MKELQAIRLTNIMNRRGGFSPDRDRVKLRKRRSEVSRGQVGKTEFAEALALLNDPKVAVMPHLMMAPWGRGIQWMIARTPNQLALSRTLESRGVLAGHDSVLACKIRLQRQAPARQRLLRSCLMR